jgi:hypothetical protein
VLRHRYRRREQVSMAGLLCYRPDWSQTKLLFAFQRGAYDTDRLVGVLDRLESFLGGKPVTLIWDNLAVHRSKAMRAYAATHPCWSWSFCRRTPQSSTRLRACGPT